MDGIDNLGGAIIDYRYLNIGRQRLFYLLELLLYITDNIDGIGAGLLLDSDTGSPYSVSVRLLFSLFRTVVQRGDITKIYDISVVIAHYDIQQFGRIGKLFLNPERISLTADVYISGRDVLVLRRNHLSDGRYGKSIRLKS